MAGFQRKVTKLDTLGYVCMSTRAFQGRSSDLHEYLYWNVLGKTVLPSSSCYIHTQTTGTLHDNALAFLHTT